MPLSQRKEEVGKETKAAMLRIERDPDAGGWRAVTLGSFPVPRFFGFKPDKVPHGIVVSNMRVYVPAMDKKGQGGTSDVYMVVKWKETLRKTGLMGEYNETVTREIVRTEPQMKVGR